MKTIVACVALALSLASTASAQAVGDWVLAQYQGQSKWYPGTIRSLNGPMITVAYDDGEVETRPANQSAGMTGR